MVLDDDHLHVVLHIVVRVVELLEELREGVACDVADQDYVALFLPGVGNSVLGAELHELVEFTGLLGHEDNDHDDEDAHDDPSEVGPRLDVTIPHCANGHHHEVEGTVEAQFLILVRHFDHETIIM